MTSIDMSVDASHFQVATCTNELQFYTIADGTRVLSPAAVRDKKWATITVPIGWSVQGCWKPDADLKYLAKGCIDGSVAVYNYPTHAPGMSMIKVLDARFVILTGAALGSWPWFKHC